MTKTKLEHADVTQLAVHKEKLEVGGECNDSPGW